MKTILLDTNFCMIPAQFNIDIFTEIHRICDFPYEIAVLETIIQELDKIMHEQKGKHKLYAKLAKLLLETKRVKVIPAEGKVDDTLASYSTETTIIATQDAGLARRFKAKNGKVITMRQKRYLVIN